MFEGRGRSSRQQAPFSNPPEPGPFEEPWQAQVFALAVSLSERGLFTWGEWAEALGAEIAKAPERAYYDAWLEALEGLIVAKGVGSWGELAALAEAWEEAAEATPHGQPIVWGAGWG
jgi:nitrile hydratase accessory protein